MPKKTDEQNWQDFINAETKTKSKISQAYANNKCRFGSYNPQTKILTLYFTDEQSKQEATKYVHKVKEKLQTYDLPSSRIEYQVGQAPSRREATITTTNNNNNNPKATPLAVLYVSKPDIYQEQSFQNLLVESVNADQNCREIYTKLTNRTKELASQNGITITLDFNWRIRVGGTRGFLELLLPKFHPVFGIPYIPASTLKGAARNWARKNGHHELAQILGTLEGNNAKAAKVEFLDAFPTKPSLSLDVATPQWHWKNDTTISYKPEPHPLLTMEQPKIVIGLRPTSQGTKSDVEKVKIWLEQALKLGIGSRVSSGYGRTIDQSTNSNQRSFKFEFWTQGLYGSEPPNKENRYQGKVEFRPTAVRGIIRYWFRSIALGLYEPKITKEIEQECFGDLSKPGRISISTRVNPPSKRDPYCYNGTIYLEATEPKYLNLASNLLILASHLGGFARGSRRPLHRLNGRMRGCYWEITSENLLTYSKDQWEKIYTDIKQDLAKIRPNQRSLTYGPGEQKNDRKQDVLDQNAQIWLIKSPNQLHPDQVNNWDDNIVKGTALNLLYGKDKFKGVSNRTGNPFVGGELGTPSFVWIKSVFIDNSVYEVVTIFGVNHPDRNAFGQELKRQGAILVFGKLQNPPPSNRSNPPAPNRPSPIQPPRRR